MKTKNNRREEFLIDSVFISDRMIRACFYLSKMTVADEIKDGQMEFTHIKFVEFLEFIGRLSHAYYETTSHHLEWLLHEKIEYVLGLLFKPQNLPVTKPETRDEFVSESDEDVY